MKILLVNKFYYPKGGADIHVLRLEELLRARGHEVAVFAMQHPENRQSPWSKYFVSHVDFSRPKISWEGLRVLGRMIWSFEAERKMRAIIRDFQPDVIHVHNIYHQLSPSIFRPMRQSNIPVVMTLHDYAMISPNYSLFANGKITEAGKDTSYWNLVWQRAMKHSLLASFVDVLAYRLQGGAMPYLKTIKRFISPSAFMGAYVQRWLRQSLPLTVLPNFTEASTVTTPRQHRIVYVGRLSAEKGVSVLLEALRGLHMAIDIVGTGPDEERVRAHADIFELSNISWHGHQPRERVAELLAGATVSVVPSIWYENNPLSILESFAQGTPVIGSDIGGIPELVKPGETGELVPAGDVAALRAVLQRVADNPQAWNAMNDTCRAQAAAHNPTEYIEQLESLYASVRA